MSKESGTNMNNVHDGHLDEIINRLLNSNTEYDFIYKSIEIPFKHYKKTYFRELDIVAKKDNYILIFEYKCHDKPSQRRKALDVQLKYAYNHFKTFDNKVFLFYVHDNNKFEWVTKDTKDNLYKES